MKLDATDLFMLMLSFAALLGIATICACVYVSTVNASACTEASYKQIKLESCGG